MQVKVVKKVGKEKPPSLKPHLIDPVGEGEDRHSVMTDREYKLVVDPDVIVPPEEITQAYRCGLPLNPPPPLDLPGM